MYGLALFKELRKSVDQWRQDGYPCDDYPYISFVLSHQVGRWQESDGNNGPDARKREVPQLKYLREPQFLALEIYWYVRLILNTPRIVDLYKHFFGDDKERFLEAIGLHMSQDALSYATIDQIMEQARIDENFVKAKKIDALHESVRLDYPSYILALAMGAGKTVLIGTIIATEFAMSLRYPDGRSKFMKNALVFAPGTTIIESLRELSSLPYAEILPPDIGRDFLANLKIEYPGKGKDIQVQAGSSYNLIVTNTEKISLRAKRRSNQTDLAFEHAEVQANQRLQKIASLPNIGIFSDEAHHTYGNTFDKIKRVRETINYINDTGVPIVAVVNTTGTPYHKKKALTEVITWYGLGEGIKDNILKSLTDGIHSYDMENGPEGVVFNDIIREFFETYGDAALPSGAKAKIAFYFKTQEHLEQSRNLIEKAMTETGEDVSQILVNTQQSDPRDVDSFKRLNNPGSLKRVILLIGRGVEGWNCPSLFACALIKPQTSPNYVLQAATRCLRQVRGNAHPAKIFLDYENSKILSKQLQDNFSTNLTDLTLEENQKKKIVLRIRKPQLPKLEITRTIERAVRKAGVSVSVKLDQSEPKEPPAILRGILTPNFDRPFDMLTPTGETKKLAVAEQSTDCHTVARRIASNYHLPVMPILRNLRTIYPEGKVPDNHLFGLFEQAERQQANYETVEEQVTEVLALIRLQDEDGKELFEKETDEDGGSVYVHRLRLLRRTCERMEQLELFQHEGLCEDRHDLSYHYTPYNFDSSPERSLFRKVLSALNTAPRDVEAFLFTGGLTNRNITDFHFEYMDQNKQYHRYFPDFVVVKKKTHEFYIVEVKSERDRDNPIAEAKKKAVERLQNIRPDKFRYQIIYTSADEVGPNDIQPIMDWAEPRQ